MKFWFNQKKEKAHDKFGHFSPDYVAELFLYCQRESLDEGVYSNIKEYLSMNWEGLLLLQIASYWVETDRK